MKRSAQFAVALVLSIFPGAALANPGPTDLLPSGAQITAATPTSCPNCLTTTSGQQIVTYKWVGLNPQPVTYRGQAPPSGATVTTVYIDSVSVPANWYVTRLTLQRGPLGVSDDLFRAPYVYASWDQGINHDRSWPDTLFDGIPVEGQPWIVTPTVYINGDPNATLVVSIAFNWQAVLPSPPPPEPQPPPAAPVYHVRWDFNGDGYSDILWTTDTGGVAIWFMKGTSLIGNSVIQKSAVSGWFIADVGDFNGDGRSDILWTTTTGGVAIWFMNGATIIGNPVIQKSAVPGWYIAGVGDFNGDKRSDILWTTASGGVAIWGMSGASIIANNVIQTSGVTGWWIRGSADLDRDGYADILWTTDTGRVAIWSMKGASIIANHSLQESGLAGWYIDDFIDIDGWQASHIIWSNGAGASSDWRLSYLQRIQDSPTPEGTNTSFFTWLKFNGDYYPDVLVSDAQGAVAIGMYTGSNYAMTTLQTASVPGWKVFRRRMH